MKPVAADLIRDLANVLGRRGYRWYVFGAQAVIVHGLVRQTADVDVTASVPVSEVPALMTDLAAAGFALRITRDVDEFIAQTRVLPLTHAASRLPLDLVLAGPGPEEGFLERAVVVEAAGTRFPVISAEDLVVVKVLAARAKDLEDVRGVLLRQRRTLDLEAIRSRLRELEALLDQSDLVRAFEQIVRDLDAHGG